ncbi:MAG: ABA4-like family protein [Ginsengibacter sp.]
MMTADTVFNITCLIAAVGWIIILFVSPFWMGYDKFLIGVIIALLALTYSWLNFANFDPEILKKFSTLDGIGELFQNKFVLTAAWVHFLAFDLLAAVWMKNNSIKHGIGHLMLIPAFVFTCMLGPLGFLIYLLTRFIKSKSYFAANFS